MYCIKEGINVNLQGEKIGINVTDMLKRKCYSKIKEYLEKAPQTNKILVVDGARQVGKAF